jgi:hypothetical protein
MKLKTIHYVLIAIIIILSILFFTNNKEKYQSVDFSKTVILNTDGSEPIFSSERVNNIFCDETDINNPICLDLFKISHPKIQYDFDKL